MQLLMLDINKTYVTANTT